MIEAKKLGALCGLVVLVIACLSAFVPWYKVSAHPDLYPTTTLRYDYELTKVVFGNSMERSYSSLADNPNYEELRNVMLVETAFVVAVAIIGAAIVVASVFDKMRLLVPLGLLAIVLCVAGLVYLALAASGISAPLIGLSGNSVFSVEGFWGSGDMYSPGGVVSTSAVFGPSVGWFLLIAVIAVLVFMIAFVLRERRKT